MEREIKFRAWDGNKMYNKVSALYPLYYREGKYPCRVDDTYTDEHISQAVIMLYTGLKDKNGNEIYEGDLLIDRYPVDEENLSLGYNESLLPVVWCDKQLMWCVDASFSKDGSYLTSLVEYFGESLEVKGNVFETPELIFEQS